VVTSPAATAAQRSVIAAASALVEAKLAPPPLRRDVLPRHALRRRLLGALGRCLVTMFAPPGYGKTTALALWAAAEPRPVAWPTDAGDADPARFLGHLAVAIDRAIGLGLACRPRQRDRCVAAVGVKAAADLDAPPRGRPARRGCWTTSITSRDADARRATMIVDYLPASATIGVAGRRDLACPAPLRASDGWWT
jgi:hypothetical protein